MHINFYEEELPLIIYSSEDMKAALLEFGGIPYHVSSRIVKRDKMRLLLREFKKNLEGATETAKYGNRQIKAIHKFMDSKECGYIKEFCEGKGEYLPELSEIIENNNTFSVEIDWDTIYIFSDVPNLQTLHYTQGKIFDVDEDLARAQRTLERAKENIKDLKARIAESEKELEILNSYLRKKSAFNNIYL